MSRIFDSPLVDELSSLKVSTLMVGVATKVTILYGDSPDVVFLDIVDNKSSSDRFLDGVAELYSDVSSLPRVTSPAVGDFCVVVWAEDSAPYRAKILAISEADSTAHVLFVDFGNEEEKIPLAELIVLDERLKTIPPFASGPYSIIPSPVSKKVVDYFTEKFYGGEEECIFQATRITEDDPQIKLIDDKNNDLLEVLMAVQIGKTVELKTAAAAIVAVPEDASSTASDKTSAVTTTSATSSADASTTSQTKSTTTSGSGSRSDSKSTSSSSTSTSTSYSTPVASKEPSPTPPAVSCASSPAATATSTPTMTRVAATPNPTPSGTPRAASPTRQAPNADLLASKMVAVSAHTEDASSGSTVEASVAIPSFPPLPQSLKDPKALALPVGRSVHFSLSETISPGEFYVALDVNEKLGEDLMTYLEAAEEFPGVEDLDIGDFCIGKFSEDEAW